MDPVAVEYLRAPPVRVGMQAMSPATSRNDSAEEGAIRRTSNADLRRRHDAARAMILPACRVVGVARVASPRTLRRERSRRSVDPTGDLERLDEASASANLYVSLSNSGGFPWRI